MTKIRVDMSSGSAEEISVKDLRILLGMTQGELANAVNVSRVTISKIEKDLQGISPYLNKRLKDLYESNTDEVDKTSK